ncbi:MAG: hypothetical protein ABJA18_01880 [bacterium]
MMLRNSPPQTTRSKLSQYLLLTLILAFPLSAVSQTTAGDTAEIKRAMQLYDQNKFVEVIPILEKLVAVHPSATVLLERLGWATFVVSSSTKDPQARKEGRARALGFLNKARDLGDNSNLLQTGLEALSQPDTIDSPLSSIRDADAALREGEAAHARGDLDNAIKGYQRALELDPKMYLAALFTGDMYFKKGYQATDSAEKKRLMATAGEWFARAISIDENVETAYRYWGDSLDAEGKSDEARDKFVDAIIAEPYERRSYVGLTQWADRHQISLTHPKINIPANVTSKKAGGVTITVDEQALKTADNDGSAAWMMYGFRRVMWMDKDGSRSKKFAQMFPNESAYRHSLPEEVEALRGVVESVLVQKKEKPEINLTASLVNLMKLNDAGLLEAYVLFVMPDEGISRDYVTYRKSNRDKLKQYWLKFVVGAAIKPPVDSDPRSKGL